MVLLVSFLFSCSDITCYGTESVGFTDPIPETVFLYIIAENKFDSPVAIRIRHYYNIKYRLFIYDEVNPSDSYETNISETTYSDWEEFRLEARETQNIGGDIFMEKKGMHLLNDKFDDGPTSAREAFSSFEIDIDTAGNNFHLAGYSTEDMHFNENRLGYFSTYVDSIEGGQGYFFETKSQTARIWEKPFVLPVKLTVLANGKYTFTHDEIVNQDGVSVWR